MPRPRLLDKDHANVTLKKGVGRQKTISDNEYVWSIIIIANYEHPNLPINLIFTTNKKTALLYTPLVNLNTLMF